MLSALKLKKISFLRRPRTAARFREELSQPVSTGTALSESRSRQISLKARPRSLSKNRGRHVPTSGDFHFLKTTIIAASWVFIQRAYRRHCISQFRSGGGF